MKVTFKKWNQKYVIINLDKNWVVGQYTQKLI